jgi:hypothetical protein
MSWTDMIYSIGDLFKNQIFLFFEVVQNYFNTLLLFVGFFGFIYWMNIQNKFNKKATVPLDPAENVGWYKDNEGKKLK